MTQEIIISTNLQAELTNAIQRVRPDRLFVLTDTTTLTACWPAVQHFPCLGDARMITIGSTDEAKTLESLASVWTVLCDGGATRHSMLINLGGGMITDLGGFAASTFKRGIAFMNIPTTLLSMVDASVGGKTGINFHGLKNEIGVFNNAATVILDTQFLRTLDNENILSGYAEMLKHGLISTLEHWTELMRFDIFNINKVETNADVSSITNHTLNTSPSASSPSPEAHPAFRHATLQRLLAESVGVKERIVEEDPTEQGIRKALNLGHTFGHAFESWALAEKRPVLHGYAVAWGLICELYLSDKLLGFPRDKFYQTATYIRENYGLLNIDCKQYERLYELMKHDKKNVAGQINFTLLAGIGDIRINQQVTKELVFEALDYYREG
ncbi:MAG: 3-dehydroquinate synthase [Bacteroidales bacterium]|nr:3-dehydroquinate synthase [Bacteroidales bacterium]